MVTPSDRSADMECDVLVVGSGGAALTAAIAARKAGLEVVVAEKEAVFGGTTATSGGMLWIPGNKHSGDLQKQIGKSDTAESARRYVVEEAGNHADIDRIDAFLKYGPEMVEFLENETHVRFDAMEYPDYNMLHPEASLARSLIAREYDAKVLGPHFRELKGELPQLLFLGFAIGSSVEMKQFFRAGHSPRAMLAVAGKMVRHLFHSAIHGGPRRVVRGKALITRLAQSAFELEIPILLSSPVVSLIEEDGRVAGAVLKTAEGQRRITARNAVILGSGGFPHDVERRRQAYPENAVDGVTRSVANPGNTGDGARLAESVGGAFSADLSNAGAWMPTSVVPGIDGPAGVFPHLVDRLKPGFVCVTQEGERFSNESSAYSAWVPKIFEANPGKPIAYTWLIGDSRAVNKWGIGRVRPWPLPKKPYIKSGYLIEAKSLADLCRQTEIPETTLAATLARFNANAEKGEDPDYGRGQNEYDHFQGDEDHTGPNICLGAVEKPPFYAMKVFGGEIGTFAGIKVDKFARAVRPTGEVIPGLYAVGNDQLNVFGGAYPGAGATLGPGLTFGYVAGRHAAGVLA